MRTLLSLFLIGLTICLNSARAQEIATINAGDQYNTAYFPSGGKFLTVSSGAPYEIAVWDAATRKELRKLKSEFGRWVKLSPKGDVVAAWDSGNGCVRILDSESFKELRVLKSASWPTSFSADGKLFATSFGTYIDLWQTATAKKLGTFKGGKTSFDTIFISPDGKKVFAGDSGVNKVSHGRDCMVYGWDVATGKKLFAIPVTNHSMKSLAMSPDGKLLLAVSWCDTLRRPAYVLEIIDVAEGKITKRRGPFGNPNVMKFSPDGKRVAVGGPGGDYLCFLDTKSWDWHSSLKSTTAIVYDEEYFRVMRSGDWRAKQKYRATHSIDSLDFSPDSKTVVTAGEKTIKLWKVPDKKIMQIPAESQMPVLFEVP